MMIDRKAKVDKVVKRLIKEMKAHCKKEGGIFDRIEWYDPDGDEIMISIENNIELADAMQYIVKDDKDAIYVKHKEYPGRYDWKAKQYIKDTSVVWFKI